MTGTLAVLRQALHSLVDESYVLLIDVKPQQPQTPCGATADAVEELKRLTYQIIVVLVILVAQKVLEMDGNKTNIHRGMCLFLRTFYYLLLRLQQTMCDAITMDLGNVVCLYFNNNIVVEKKEEEKYCQDGRCSTE